MPQKKRMPSAGGGTVSGSGFARPGTGEKKQLSPEEQDFANRASDPRWANTHPRYDGKSMLTQAEKDKMNAMYPGEQKKITLDQIKKNMSDYEKKKGKFVPAKSSRREGDVDIVKYPKAKLTTEEKKFIKKSGGKKK